MTFSSVFDLVVVSPVRAIFGWEKPEPPPPPQRTDSQSSLETIDEDDVIDLEVSQSQKMSWFSLATYAFRGTRGIVNVVVDHSYFLIPSAVVVVSLYPLVGGLGFLVPGVGTALEGFGFFYSSALYSAMFITIPAVELYAAYYMVYRNMINGQFLHIYNTASAMMGGGVYYCLTHPRVAKLISTTVARFA